jgi:hypothetical protein
MSRSGGANDDDDGGRTDDDASDGAVTLPVKKKVTLAFAGPPLALPGDPRDPGTPPRPHQRVPDAPGTTAHDGWSRDRVSRGSGVHPAVSATPSTPPGPSDDERPSSVEALDLVERRRPSEPALDLATEVSERFALDDFTGALRAAELLLGRIPGHEEAARYADLCRTRLEQIYEARLGNLGAAPRVVVPESEVRWLGLDHRAGFLLSLIDGRVTVSELVDVSGMGRLEVLKTLVDLLDAGTISI